MNDAMNNHHQIGEEEITDEIWRLRKKREATGKEIGEEDMTSANRISSAMISGTSRRERKKKEIGEEGRGKMLAKLRLTARNGS